MEIVFTAPKPILDFSTFVKYFLFNHFGGAASIFLIKLLLNHWEMQKHTYALEKQKAELELKLLKTQLNPHFLFNTLNNIYSLSLYQSPMTSEAIARLSEILDHILYRCNSVTIPLSSEIKLLENYIALEKLRYDDTLKVYFKSEIEQEIEIAPLILLSLVENAFKHGVGEVVGFPFISIDLKVDNQAFYFQIENTYLSDNEEDTREKIGLQNLRQQLNLIYPNQYQLDVTQSKNLFKVNLKINL
jgi:LytS/YehU family sensor histidine kinase